MSYSKLFQYLTVVFFLFVSKHSFASHIYSMELSYRCLDNNQFLVQLEIYSDCQGISLPSQSNIECSSSCSPNLQFNLPLQNFYETTPLCPSAISPCLGGTSALTGIEYYLYQDTLTLVPCTDWFISTDFCCRNPNIINLSATTNSNYASIELNNSTSCNNSVELTAPLFIYASQGRNNIHYPMAYDIDGDSLVFEIVNTKENGLPISFLAGFSSANPFGPSSTFSFDPNNGQFSYNIAATGVYSMGLEIKEFRNGNLINTSYRELIVAAYNNQNNSPEFAVTNIQGAVLKDNIFYVYDNDSISFDIVAIDSNTTDTLSFESTIDTIGGSFTTTGNNPQTADFRWYNSSNALQEFKVTIKDDACSSILGVQEFGFAIVQTRCLPDTITAIVAADSSYSIQADCPWANSYIFSNIIAPTSPAFGSLSIDSSTNSVVYQAGSNVQVQDDFWLYYTVNNGQFQDSVWVEITTVSCVWAGDTDTNKVVNHFDILPLGLGFGQTGTVRPNADINYDCEPALNFVNSTPVTGTNYKHADTDGNGLVNANDTVAIIQNWGLIHLKNSYINNQTGIPFFIDYETAIPGQTVQIPIILGDSTVPADSIYGIAFSINYDETLTDSNSVYVDFNTSWLGTNNTDLINIQKDFYTQGKIDVGVVRTDQVNRSGIGQIGSFNLTIKDDILKSNTQRLDLLISDVRIITNAETERVAATPPTDILISIASNLNPVLHKDIRVNMFPNPVKDQLFIQSNDAIQTIELIDMTGRILQQKKGEDALQQTLSLAGFSNGMYLIRVSTSQQTKVQKIMVQRP